MQFHILLLASSLAISSSVWSLAVPRDQGFPSMETQGPIGTTWVGVEGRAASAIPDRSVPDTDSSFLDVSVFVFFSAQS